MRKKIQSWLFYRLLFHPAAVFEELSDLQPSPYSVFFRYLLWLAVLPPLFSYIGASRVGWHLGAAEPLFVVPKALLALNVAYFLALVTSFVTTAILSHWMAATYGGRRGLGVHFAMVTIVAATPGRTSVHDLPLIALLCGSRNETAV